MGGPSSLNIIDRSSISDFAWNKGSLSRSSAKMHPTDHMSTAVEYDVAPSRISGALWQSLHPKYYEQCKDTPVPKSDD